MTLHKLVLICLIKISPKLFDRYMNEYLSVKIKYIAKQIKREYNEI